MATVEAILRNRHGNHALPQTLVALARHDFTKLSIATAQKRSFGLCKSERP